MARIPRRTPVVEADRVHLGAVGERHEQIGQLGVALVCDEPPLDTARAGPTEVSSV